MRLTRLVPIGACLLLAVGACGNATEETATPAPADSPPAASGVGSTGPGAGAESAAPMSPATAPAETAGALYAGADEGATRVAQTPPAGAAAAPQTVIAVQETNWAGVIAEVTEFKRKGNTLTAKVRFRNQGSDNQEPRVGFDEAYLMDLAAGKKYEVLKDQENSYIASLRSGWKNQWYDTIEPGESRLIWMKFPAPPADVKTVTLQVPGVPPFEDLPIQEG